MRPRQTSLHFNLVVMAAVEVAHACHTQAIHGETEREVRTSLGRHELIIPRQRRIGGEQFLSVQNEDFFVFIRPHILHLAG